MPDRTNVASRQRRYRRRYGQKRRFGGLSVFWRRSSARRPCDSSSPTGCSIIPNERATGGAKISVCAAVTPGHQEDDIRLLALAGYLPYEYVRQRVEKGSTYRYSRLQTCGASDATAHRNEDAASGEELAATSEDEALNSRQRRVQQPDGRHAGLPSLHRGARDKRSVRHRGVNVGSQAIEGAVRMMRADAILRLTSGVRWTRERRR
jgi:hypothetical protein